VVARRDLGPGRTLWLVKPQTFMNASGTAVSAQFARYHRIEPASEVAAVYDDLTIDLGLVKVSVTGSDGGHNGVASLLEHLGRPASPGFRLGIRPEGARRRWTSRTSCSPASLKEQLNIIQQQDRRPTFEGLELLLTRRPRPGDEPAQPKRPSHE
jgi:PTH1 family peptidyl-tRNA hydrolase